MVQLPKGGLLNEFIRRSLRGDDGGWPSCISVIDPGTEYVKALVVGIEGEGVNVIGYGVDRHREMPYDRGTRAVDVRLRQACESALREAEDMTESVVSEKRVPDHTIMAFPPHLVRQGAFTVRHRRTSPGQEITIRELEQVFSRVERLAIQQLARQLGADRSELSLIGSDIVDIKVGEHSVSTPLGFCGETLSVTIFNALARNQYIEIMVRLAEHLEVDLLHLLPEEYALADCVPVEEAVVVNVGSLFSSLAWVKGGCPVKMLTVPWGGRNLTRYLASVFQLSPDQAESLKLRYGLGRLEHEEGQAMRDVVLSGVAEWLVRVESGLAALAGKNSLPPFIYLCGGGAELPEVLESARSFPWLRHLNFSRYPEVHAFGPSQIGGVFNRTGHRWGAEMAVAAALTRWAVPRKPRDEHLESVFKRVIRRNVAVYSGG